MKTGTGGANPQAACVATSTRLRANRQKGVRPEVDDPEVGQVKASRLEINAMKFPPADGIKRTSARDPFTGATTLEVKGHVQTSSRLASSI